MTAVINIQTAEQGTTGKNNNDNMKKGTMNHENHNIIMATREYGHPDFQRFPNGQPLQVDRRRGRGLGLDHRGGDARRR